MHWRKRGTRSVSSPNRPWWSGIWTFSGPWLPGAWLNGDPDPELRLPGTLNRMTFTLCWRGRRVRVEFTLTAPGCGMGDFLRQDMQQKLLAIPGVKEAEVQVVLDPPWDQSMMSDVARLQLGLM